MLVEPSNLALALSGDLPDGTPVNKQELEPAVPEVEVKLSLAFYERKEKEKAKDKDSKGNPEKGGEAPGKAPTKAP